MRRSYSAAFAGAAALVVVPASVRYRRDLNAARARLAQVGRRVFPTAWGAVERRAAERIPGARFLGLESGGHLMLGQTKIVHDALADFFADRIAEQITKPSLGDSG